MYATSSSSSSIRLRLRRLGVVCVVALVAYCFLVAPESSLGVLEDSVMPSRATQDRQTTPVLDEDTLNNHSLGKDQCAASFPGLFKEVDEAVARGPFELEYKETSSSLLARIRGGELSILRHPLPSSLSAEMLEHRSATLHQIAIAILTSPSPSELPNDTILALNTLDDPFPRTLSYSRPVDFAAEADGHYFPMPHFSFYAWPVPYIRSLPHASRATTSLEASLPFQFKSAKVIWRGTVHFNNARLGPQRQKLIKIAGGKPWADVEALKPGLNASSSSGNALQVEDFCRHKYVLYTEGITYSGRLQFHQLCASVLLAQPLRYLQHLAHLIRPVYSHNLLHSSSSSSSSSPPTQAQAPPFWPRNLSADKDDDAVNAVFVSPDWSDLEATLAWLEAHPREAERIAARQRALFHGGGYFSPAAEMCYWRALLRGWGDVVRYRGGGAFDEEMGGGVAWEEFSVQQAR